MSVEFRPIHDRNAFGKDSYPRRYVIRVDCICGLKESCVCCMQLSRILVYVCINDVFESVAEYAALEGPLSRYLEIFLLQNE